MRTPFVRIVKFKFLAQFPVSHLLHPVVPILILFWLLHSFIMLLIISSLSPHSLHQLFCYVYSCFDIVIIALFCAAIRRDSVSLLRLPFLNNVQVFSCKISLFCRLKCSYSYFSFHFCFLIIFVLLMLELSVLFLIAVISFLCIFNTIFESFYWCIDAVFKTDES